MCAAIGRHGLAIIEDIHARTARAIFGIAPEDEVPGDARSKAKAVNFGVIYGQSAFGLAQTQRMRWPKRWTQ